MFLFEPSIHAAVLLKASGAQAPYFNTITNVPLLSYLNSDTTRCATDGKMKRRLRKSKEKFGRRVGEKWLGLETGTESSHNYQKGSAVDPPIHAQAGASSITGIKSSEVAFTV